MKQVTMVLCALIVVGLARADEIDQPLDETPDGLVRFPDTPFELAYLKPGVDLSRYTKIQVRPISIAYREEPPASRSAQRKTRNYKLSDEQRKRVSRAFAAAFTEAMTGDGRFKLTTEPGFDALMVRVALAQIAVYVPTRPKHDKAVLMVDEAAAVTLVVELRDSMSKEPLARGRDTRSVKVPSGSYQQGQPEEVRAEVRRVFEEWSRLLRAGLDRFSPGWVKPSPVS